ncbi:MAG: hypothetical protein QME40_02400 [bacterium]|nr:hypothetical protein [bacterium]
MDLSILLGAWVAAGLTLFIFSFLYKDNFFFKLGEHLYIGVSVGYSITLLIFKFMRPKWFTPLFGEHQWILLIPTLLGILILTRFIPRLSWPSRLTFAFIFGFGAGLTIPRSISGYILQQIQGTVIPMITKEGTQISYTFRDFSNLLVFIGVLTVLIYFFFSVEHKGAINILSRIGILFLMISFGASFGYTAMARMSLLFGRCYDLTLFSSKRYYYATPILLCLIILCFLIHHVLSKKHSV